MLGGTKGAGAGQEGQVSRVFKLSRIFPEGFLALLAHESHLKALEEVMVGLFCVAFGAVEPLAACFQTNADISNFQAEGRETPTAWRAD